MDATAETRDQGVVRPKRVIVALHVLGAMTLSVLRTCEEPGRRQGRRRAIQQSPDTREPLIPHATLVPSVLNDLPQTSYDDILAVIALAILSVRAELVERDMRRRRRR